MADSIFNLQALASELQDVPWEEDEPGQQTRQVFLGTVFALYPSGKFYMPYACSNVTEGGAEKDEEWREQAEAELAEIGACLVSGEGDPCDLFAAQYRDTPEDEPW